MIACRLQSQPVRGCGVGSEQLSRRLSAFKMAVHANRSDPRRWVNVNAKQAGVTEAAYEAGWRNAAIWAERTDLILDIGSRKYDEDMQAAIGAEGQPDPQEGSAE